MDQCPLVDVHNVDQSGVCFQGRGQQRRLVVVTKLAGIIEDYSIDSGHGMSRLVGIFIVAGAPSLPAVIGALVQDALTCAHRPLFE